MDCGGALKMAGWAKVQELDYGMQPWRWAVSLRSVDPGDFRAIIDELKEAVPSRDRKWDPGGRRWLLRSMVEVETVCSILSGWGVAYEHDAQSAPAPAPADAWAELYLRPGAPDFVIDAVFRAMAKRAHPDAGGTHEEMIRINSAAERLRQNKAGGRP